ncbi:restriction endonuclease [Sphingomonas sp.]|uniref:restriction endonuclease n=1 Tax=Sphingomonas sp. TaxID=28214 RepID=UPI0025FDC7BB|nr:restriction endonuclease [Sphingomonas sp.]
MSISIPTHEDFMLPTLRVLESHGGSATNEEIVESLIEMLGITPAQMEVTYPTSGVGIVVDRMSWARSYLKYPGFVDNPKRKMWVLTEEGRDALALSDAEIRKAVSKGYAERHAKKKADADATGPETVLIADAPSEQEEAEWTDALLAKLKTMPPDGFERLAQRLLRESGFVRVEVTGKSGDGGIDGSGVLRMNLISFQVLFQCKRYAGSVPTGTVRDFRGAMQGRADKGLIITTGTFTADARKEATRDGAPAIDLIDGEALCQLLKERGLGVRVREVVREEVTLVPEFFDEI